MTNQEIFDKVATHLLTQKKKSEIMRQAEYGIPKPACAYRAADGSTCAIGCLIPDDIFQPGMEGLRVQTLMVYYESIRDLFANNDASLLGTLQVLHDNYPVSTWKSELAATARMYKLDDKVLENFQ
jgi:hypothetical protein